MKVVVNWIQGKFLVGAFFLFLCSPALGSVYNCGITVIGEGREYRPSKCGIYEEYYWEPIQYPLCVDPECVCKYIRGLGDDVRYDWWYGTPGLCELNSYRIEGEVCIDCPNPPTGDNCDGLSCPEGTRMTEACSCICAEGCPNGKTHPFDGSCDCFCRPVLISEDLYTYKTCENGFFTYAFSFGFMYLDTNEYSSSYNYTSDVRMYKGNNCTGSGETSSCASWEAFGSGESGTWWNDFPDGIYKWHIKISNSCGELLVEYDRFYNHECQCACSDPVPGGPPVF